MTNAERIKNMSNKEPADFLYNFQDRENGEYDIFWKADCNICKKCSKEHYLNDCLLNWLKKKKLMILAVLNGRIINCKIIMER